MKNILAIPGSLRAGSSNHHTLNYLGALIPKETSYHIYDRMATIPPFDPGNDNGTPPAPVSDLRELIAKADAIIICTPEYAFGIPGQLKNTLDWTVSSGSFTGKPTALITASTGGEHAHEALLKVLGAIDAKLSEETTLLIPYIRSKMDAQGNITDKKTDDEVRSVLQELLKRM